MKTQFHGEARLENLKLFRAFIEQACQAVGARPNICFDLKLAVDEACTNIVVHGYKGHEPGPIDLSFESDGERITVEITDRGLAFDPRQIPPPDLGAQWQNRSSGGLGWHLIASSVDEIAYHPGAPAQNRLVLVKRVRTPESG